ncbi:hypothetical protein [Kribbella deserti]|uniref:Uncharacterized protein n=1 Tax=Kribbella deserti TaxID=1926257 RepID=A0ABV6QQP8_9ACTN
MKIHQPIQHRLTAVALLAGLALTGCGDESGPVGGPAQTASPAPSASPSAEPSPSTTVSPSTSSSPSPTADALPLVLTRDGGFAGFADRIAIGPDGIADVSTRRGKSRCRVEAGLLATIKTAAAKIDWSALESKPPTEQHPDDMIVAVAAQGGIARLEDPRVQPLEDPLGQLLKESYQPDINRSLCKPV